MAISKIISSSISDNTVVAADIGPNAVGTSELEDDAVTGAKIENNPTIAGNLTVGGNVAIPDGGNIGSASDTDAISISSTGKVTTADSELNVKTTSHTFTVKGIDEAIGDAMPTRDPTTTDSDSGQFAVYNGSTKLFGITEHGYVLKPNVPSFRATEDTNASAFANNAYAVWTNDLGSSGVDYFQQGITYDTTNGRATVPVSGLYCFIVSMLNNSSVSIETSFRKNGVEINGTRNYANPGGHVGVFNQLIINLSAGDYINVYVITGPAYGDNYSHFSGYLIG